MFTQTEQKKHYIIKQEKCAKNHPDEPTVIELKREFLLGRNKWELWSSLGTEDHGRIHFKKWKQEKYFLKRYISKAPNWRITDHSKSNENSIKNKKKKKMPFSAGSSRAIFVGFAKYLIS